MLLMMMTFNNGKKREHFWEKNEKKWKIKNKFSLIKQQNGVGTFIFIITGSDIGAMITFRWKDSRCLHFEKIIL